ncbi:helix-turn-helix domain containing protein [Bacillus cereus]|nr:helix-turn-helix domain containing protein [Bacillus cereus]MEB9570793.1 helix-turn-helix domain containing protein [Bacillus cereus]
MNEIITSLIHDKSEIRQLSILKILNESNDIVTSSTLAKQLKCTNRTIINDIAQLKRDIPNSWSIVGVKSQGYILIKPVTEDISTIIGSYLGNSTSFKILLGVFSGRRYKLEKWSQLLFMDKLTLKNHLGKLNKILKHFGLQFSFKTLQLKGEELYIRCFFINFFYSIQKFIDHFQLDTNIKKTIYDILKLHEIKVDFNILTIIINVCINRISQKCYFTQKGTFNYIFDENQFECFNKIILVIEEFFNIVLPKNEKIFLYTSFFLIAEGTMEQKLKLIHLYQTSHEEFPQLHFGLYKSFLQKNEFEDEELLAEILFTLYKTHIVSSYKLYFEYYLYYKILPQNILPLYNEYYSLIVQWNSKYNQNKFNESQLSYIALSVIQLLLPKIKKTKILLLLSGTTVWKNHVYFQLNNELGKDVIIIQDLNNKFEYDFIITNYKIEYNDMPIITISDTFNSNDIFSIRQFIYNYIIKGL